jgi:hypothetical protein
MLSFCKLAGICGWKMKHSKITSCNYVEGYRMKRILHSGN